MIITHMGNIVTQRENIIFVMFDICFLQEVKLDE